MAGFGSAGPSEPGIEMAGFESDASPEPEVEMAGIADAKCTYLPTVSRWMPSSWAIRRCDQPWARSARIAC